MLSQLQDLMLWAQVTRHLSRNFRPGSSHAQWDQWLWLATILAVLGLLVWWMAHFFQHKERRAYYSPRRLMRELCSAHGLDRGSRQLLRQLADFHQLTCPARLFVEPERFETATLNSRLQARRSDLEALQTKLFDPSAT